MKMDYTILMMILYFILCLLLNDAPALTLKNLTVPRVVNFRDIAKLTCKFDIKNHTLNSVKWYKDGQEFFRYSPMTSKNFLQFNVNGVKIKAYNCNQFICMVELNELTLNSSGAYRCEVSGDAPEFKLVGQQANMTVGVLPQFDPFINGTTENYRFSDYIIATCASDWSYPPSSITWFINDEMAPQDFIQSLPELSRISDNGFKLYQNINELRFYIDNPSFILTTGKLYIRCISDIMRIPELRRETIIKVIVQSRDDLNNEKLVNNNAIGIIKSNDFRQIGLLIVNAAICLINLR